MVSASIRATAALSPVAESSSRRRARHDVDDRHEGHWQRRRAFHGDGDIARVIIRTLGFWCPASRCGKRSVASAAPQPCRGRARHESRRRWRRCRSGAVSWPAGPVFGVSGAVASDERLEDFADGGPFGVVEECGGFEGESQCLVVGEAGVVSEDEGVGRARQSDR